MLTKFVKKVRSPQKKVHLEKSKIAWLYFFFLAHRANDSIMCSLGVASSLDDISNSMSRHEQKPRVAELFSWILQGNGVCQLSIRGAYCNN